MRPLLNLRPVWARTPQRFPIVPVGTNLKIRIEDSLSSKDSRVGDRFTATALDPVRFNEGRITGHISSIQKSGKIQGRTSMNLAFDTIALGDRTSTLHGYVTRVYGGDSGSRADNEGGVESGKIPALIRQAGGSPGRALSYAALDLAPLHDQALAILRGGDPINERRSKLAQSLGLKASADRYVAFLQIVPTLIADEARLLDGPARLRALNAYRRARETCLLAPRLSFDPGATVFQLGTILASVAPEGASV